MHNGKTSVNVCASKRVIVVSMMALLAVLVVRNPAIAQTQQPSVNLPQANINISGDHISASTGENQPLSGTGSADIDTSTTVSPLPASSPSDPAEVNTNEGPNGEMQAPQQNVPPSPPVPPTSSNQPGKPAQPGSVNGETIDIPPGAMSISTVNQYNTDIIALKYESQIADLNAQIEKAKEDYADSLRKEKLISEGKDPNGQTNSPSGSIQRPMMPMIQPIINQNPKSSDQPQEPQQQKIQFPTVSSIWGVNGQMIATMILPNGHPVQATVGEDLGGGMVVDSIDGNGVVVEYEGVKQLLSFGSGPVSATIQPEQSNGFRGQSLGGQSSSIPAQTNGQSFPAYVNPTRPQVNNSPAAAAAELPRGQSFAQPAPVLIPLK